MLALCVKTVHFLKIFDWCDVPYNGQPKQIGLFCLILFSKVLVIISTYISIELFSFFSWFPPDVLFKVFESSKNIDAPRRVLFNYLPYCLVYGGYFFDIPHPFPIWRITNHVAPLLFNG